MNRKIDLNQPPLWNNIPWRVTLVAALLCLITSLNSFGQAPNFSAQMVSYEAYLAQIDQSTPDGIAAYQSMVNKIESELLASYYTMSTADQAAFLDWLSHQNSTTGTVLFGDDSQALHKFNIGLQASQAQAAAASSGVSQPSAGNFVINGAAAAVPANIPVKSPYTDTFPEIPVK